MRSARMLDFIFALVIVSALSSCAKKKAALVWNQSFYQIGSQSSPRATDLNQDGVLDIVIGAGMGEIGATDHGVMALDGITGSLIWKQEASASVVGSATFYDVTGDGVDDVFIGGRAKYFVALNGKNGEIIWSYKYSFEDDSILQYAKYNFYNSVLVPDQNADGLPDLLAVNGGNWDAVANSVDDRYPGVLMLFDLKTGAILAADTMPDGKETYMSPLCLPREGQPNDPYLVFGTGGETMGGNLYLATMTQLLEKNLTSAKVLVSENGHGFIAPPVAVDLTDDGTLDLVVISHAATISAINGVTQTILWQHRFENVESSNGCAVGNFTGDKTPDIFAVMDVGVWPNYSNAIQMAIDGATGDITYRDSIGCFMISSPVVYNLGNKGLDEVIMSVNLFDCSIRITEDTLSPAVIENQMVALNLTTQQTQIIDQSKGFKNVFSTPWIGDLDNDKYLDIVYCQYFNPNNFQRFLGMSVKRVDTPIKMKKTVQWGEYLGSKRNSIFN